MPGPLPKPDARRRNAPTIPTTTLPAGGRRGRSPKVPAAYELGDAGAAWWKWAWRLPQAAAWGTGDLYVIARRATLEDDLAALEFSDHFDLEELLDIEDGMERYQRLRSVIQNLKGMASGRTNVMREMRELDDRLGLSPKGFAALRWKIVAEEEAPAATPARPKVRRLRAVDPAAAAG